MFRKTIQNIQTQRTVIGNYPTQQQTNGYNTQRHDRYQQDSSKLISQQRKTPTSGQFSQLKKAQLQQQANKTSQLVIRECDVNELNTYPKKPTSNLLLRPPLEENYYLSNNSSNKKQRHQQPIISNPQRKPTYDSSSYKQPLQQIHFSDRQNSSSSRLSPTSQQHFNQYYQQQLQTIKQYMFQLHQQQSTSLKSLRQDVKSIQLQCMGELENFANQISQQLNKQKDDMIGINKRGIETQREVRHFKEMFNEYVKDNQQKLQCMVLEMNGGAGKKSRVGGDQFGVQLKSSSHCISGGVGTSMSVNFQNQNVTMKLYNQMSGQIQVLKGELEICKEKILLLEKDTKMLEKQRKTNEVQQQKTFTLPEQKAQRLQLQQVEKLIIEKFSQQRKKNSFNQKIQQLDLKTKDLYKVYQDIDSNIKGMNAEFTRVINGTVIKKEKMLEAKLNLVQEKVTELGDRTSAQAIQDMLRPQVTKLLQEKSLTTKVIKIRQPTQKQKQKLSSVSSVANTQFTYMLDQQGHLLDCSGNYVVETLQNGVKQKIKIQKNLLYMLETQGIEIKA